MRRHLIGLFVIAFIAALVLVARANAGWVKWTPNHCSKQHVQQPQTISCRFVSTHRIHIHVQTTTGAERLRWTMKCAFLPSAHIENVIPGRRTFDSWVDQSTAYDYQIDQNTQYLAFDLMSFGSCQLRVEVWLMTGSTISSWKITPTPTEGVP